MGRRTIWSNREDGNEIELEYDYTYTNTPEYRLYKTELVPIEIEDDNENELEFELVKTEIAYLSLRICGDDTEGYEGTKQFLHWELLPKLNEFLNDVNTEFGETITKEIRIAIVEQHIRDMERFCIFNWEVDFDDLPQMLNRYEIWHFAA